MVENVPDAKGWRRNKKSVTFYVAYFEDVEHYEALRGVGEDLGEGEPSSLLGVSVKELQVGWVIFGGGGVFYLFFSENIGACS